MTYLRYALVSILSIALDIVSRLLLNWIVVLFTDKDGNLPRWCYWWQTFDATLYEGQYCRQREIIYGGDTWIAFNPFPQTTWQRYKNRAFWLFRNSCYGFSYYPLGIKWAKADWTVTTYINTPEKILFIAQSKQGHFNLYYHGKFGMYKLGWKAWNMHQVIDGIASFHDGNGMGGKGRIPHVISANPFKTKPAA